MAYKQDGNHFFKWRHFEKGGKPETRRISYLTMQMANGEIIKIEGEKLPDEMTSFNVPPKEGKSFAHAILDPKNALKPEYRLLDLNSDHPIKGRDVIAALFGFLFAMFLNAFLHGIADLLGI